MSGWSRRQVNVDFYVSFPRSFIGSSQQAQVNETGTPGGVAFLESLTSFLSIAAGQLKRSDRSCSASTSLLSDTLVLGVM